MLCKRCSLFHVFIKKYLSIFLLNNKLNIYIYKLYICLLQYILTPMQWRKLSKSLGEANANTRHQLLLLYYGLYLQQ